MKIFIYWNAIDRDSKKIYQFLDKKDGAILSLSQKEDDIIYFHDPRFGHFNITPTIINEINDSDIIMFFTHGEDDAVLKSLYKNYEYRDRYIFVDCKNATLLSNKKVISICCSSAKTLGPYCVSDEIGSKFFIGFQESIYYDDNNKYINLRHLIYNAYSSAFERSLINSYNLGYTANQFVRVLKKSILDEVTKQVLTADNHSLGSIAPITFHQKSAQSLVALGDASLPIFI